MALTAIGESPQTRLLKHESHKLHHEFTVEDAEAVRIGMPVKLTVDGKVLPLGAADEEHLCIGYALQDAEETEYVTIVMKGYSIIFAETLAALDCGPVKFASFGAQPLDLPEYVAAATNVLTQGWCIDQAAGINETVRIVVRA